MDPSGTSVPGSRSTSLPTAALLAVALSAGIVLLGQTALLGPGNSTRIVALGLMWLLAALVVLWWMRQNRAEDLGLARPTGRDLAWGVGSGILLMLLVFGVLTAAVCEEVIFRGGLMSALQDLGLPTWARVVFQAAAFSLIHAAWPWPHVLFVVLAVSAST